MPTNSVLISYHRPRGLFKAKPAQRRVLLKKLLAEHSARKRCLFSLRPRFCRKMTIRAVQTSTTDNALTSKPLVKRPKGTYYHTLLSVDGGGVRGIIPLTVLAEVEREIKSYIIKNRQELIPQDVRHRIHTENDFDIDLTDYFDLVAGTSIGSWLACYVASRGRGAKETLESERFINQHGKHRAGSMDAARAAFRAFSSVIFPKRGFFNSVASMFRPTYAHKGLERSLRDFFGDATMDDLETSCLITSYDLERNAACSFLHDHGAAENYTVVTSVRNGPRFTAKDKELEAKQKGESAVELADEKWTPDLEIIQYRNYRLRDIALASSSAPSYFRPARIRSIDAANAEEQVLIDGGMVANNPTLQALTYAPNTLRGVEIGRMAILSVGCGVAEKTNARRRNPGALWWMISGYLVDVFMNGTGEYIQAVVDVWIHHNINLPVDQYIRIQLAERDDTPDGEILENMDDSSRLDDLERIGKRLADMYSIPIKRYVEDYIFGKEKVENKVSSSS